MKPRFGGLKKWELPNDNILWLIPQYLGWFGIEMPNIYLLFNIKNENEN
jgi:hypothetical protein